MINQETIKMLKSELEKITRYSDKELIRRAGWGDINFQAAEQDIDLVFSIATDLIDLPLEFLTENTINNITSHIPSVVAVLEEIDVFNLSGDPGSRCDEIVQNLHDTVETLKESASPYIPYLAYKRGDVSQNIDALNNAKNQAEALLEETKQTIEQKQEQIEGIISAARESAATVGVATFTQEFDREATDLKNRSLKWLGATGVFAILTIIAAVLFYFWPKVSPDAMAWESIRNIVSKTATIAVLFTATIWCGRIYRALMHQSTINRHRALSLKTFQAFVAATYDDRIKDAVLMAATRTIFGRVPTGLVSDSGSEHDSEVNFVEIGRPPTDRFNTSNSR